MSPEPPPPGLAAKLTLLRDALAGLGGRVPAARRALELLERDLLPRTAGGDGYLVCGIVGPNNAGKSALFNALVGRDVSPSMPAGGATRRLVGAASPELLAALQAAPALTRFRLQPHAGATSRVDAALESAVDPAELIVEAVDSMPANLLLIDTPDFDSILRDNRLASESLLAVADLVVAVVTRHSYQNREVVNFLEGWLSHGRPWMLVYNEAISEDVARGHAAKLVSDVGHEPLASFWAPHSLAVQDGTEALIAHRLAHDGDAGSETLSLSDLLRDADRIAAVKARAFAAALARLRDDLEAAADDLAAEGAEARQVLAVVAARASVAGSRIAASAMPAGPFVDAFRIVLDRRSNFLSRGWRSMLRGVRLRVESLARVLGGASRQPDAGRAKGLAEIEQEALRVAWPEFWEEIARDLGPEARDPVRRACRREVAAGLDADLADGRRAKALEEAGRGMAVQSADLDAFRGACEKLIEQAIEERGFDLDIQAAADIATLAPIALAAAVIVQTGGFGVDLAILGGGAVGTFLMEKYSHFLGSRILTEARRRWAALRGAQMAEALLEAALEQSAPRLRQTAARQGERAAELRALRGSLL